MQLSDANNVFVSAGRIFCWDIDYLARHADSKVFSPCGRDAHQSCFLPPSRSGLLALLVSGPPAIWCDDLLSSVGSLIVMPENRHMPAILLPWQCCNAELYLDSKEVDGIALGPRHQFLLSPVASPVEFRTVSPVPLCTKRTFAAPRRHSCPNQCAAMARVSDPAKTPKPRRQVQKQTPMVTAARHSLAMCAHALPSTF